MMERKLRSRSFSLERDVETCQETFSMEVEADNASQGTEKDGAIVELNEEVNSVTDRQVKSYSDSSNNIVMSANPFHNFISTVMNEFDDLKASVRA